MLYVPPPWLDEMLSSLFTRISLYYGFSERRTIYGFLNVWSVISQQFPKRLRLAASYMGESWTARRLLMGHTFYPLAAPFLEEALRGQLAADMLRSRFGGQNRRPAYGNMPSGLRLETYRFCPLCWAEQNERLPGDCGWLRGWQIPQVTTCLKHGVPLWDTGEPVRDRYNVPRNLPCSAIDMRKSRPIVPDRHAETMRTTAKMLLLEPPKRKPSQKQWQLFWDRKLRNLTDEQLAEAGSDYWGADWLTAHGIQTIDRSLLRPANSRCWWKVLLLLKAADPASSMQDAITEASWIRHRAAKS